VLVVRLGPYLFALDVAIVAGLAPLASEAPGGGLVAGTARFQRSEIGVLSISGRLRVAAPGEQRQVVVVSLYGLRVGVLVDGVVELSARQRPALQPLPPGLTELPDGALRGWVSCEGISAYLLDLEALLPVSDLEALGELLV
jgi:chemotaxis signal transduction protein